MLLKKIGKEHEFCQNKEKHAILLLAGPPSQNAFAG